MEVDPPPADLTPPASHLLAYSTLGASEKSEPMSNLPETLARPQKDLFSQDISVKMASELLFKLSGMFLSVDTQGSLSINSSTATAFPLQRCSVNLGQFVMLGYKTYMFPFPFSSGPAVKARIYDM